MKNNPDKEINQFLETFEPRNSLPSDVFKRKLEKKMISEYKGKSKFSSYFQVLLPVLLVFFIFGVSMGGVNFGKKNTTQDYSVNAERKQQIFAKLASANILPKIEQSIVSNDISSLSDISFSESEEKSLIKESGVTLVSYPISFPDEPILGVSETVVKGAKFYTCDTLIERYEGVDEIKSYYYATDTDTVVKVEEKVATEEDVLGESFPNSYPDSYPLSYALDNGLDILSDVVEGDKTYFVLKVEKDVDGCEEKIIFTIKMDDKTLEIKEVETYREEITESNLIFKTEFEALQLLSEWTI